MKRDYYSDSFFFYPHELTKIVLQKFYKILLHQNALFGLANWTEMVLPVFPRIIPNRARPKSPPFQFFSALRDIFFSEFFFRIFFPKGSPLHFFDVLRQNGCWKTSKGPPFQFFSALWDFFPENEKNFFLQFFHVLRQNGCWKTSKGPPFQFFGIVRL